MEMILVSTVLGVHLPHDIDDKEHGTDVPSVYTAETQVARHDVDNGMEAAWIDPYLRPQVGFFTHIEVERKLNEPAQKRDHV